MADFTTADLEGANELLNKTLTDALALKDQLVASHGADATSLLNSLQSKVADLESSLSNMIPELPTVPNVNECPIRCVPSSCLHELSITLADDIKLPSIVAPYHLFSVSNSKFVKGMTDMPNQAGITIKSHDIETICDNTELDNNDKPITIKLHYKNTNFSGTGAPTNLLSPGSFNSVKGYFNKEFENFLVNKPELQLNDYPNNPPNPIIKPTGKRYLINSLSKNDNKVILYLSLNKRAFGYNQLTGIEIHQLLSTMVGTHKISMKIFEKDYHLILEKVELANLYVFDPEKIDWTKTFVDPELMKEEEKVNKIIRGGVEYESDPFKFNKDMDSFLKINNNMESLGISNSTGISNSAPSF